MIEIIFKAPTWSEIQRLIRDAAAGHATVMEDKRQADVAGWTPAPDAPAGAVEATKKGPGRPRKDKPAAPAAYPESFTRLAAWLPDDVPGGACIAAFPDADAPGGWRTPEAVWVRTVDEGRVEVEIDGKAWILPVESVKPWPTPPTTAAGPSELERIGAEQAAALAAKLADLGIDPEAYATWRAARVSSGTVENCDPHAYKAERDALLAEPAPAPAATPVITMDDRRALVAHAQALGMEVSAVAPLVAELFPGKTTTAELTHAELDTLRSTMEQRSGVLV